MECGSQHDHIVCLHFISEKIKKLIVMNNDGLNEAFLPHQKECSLQNRLKFSKMKREATMFQKIQRVSSRKYYVNRWR